MEHPCTACAAPTATRAHSAAGKARFPTTVAARLVFVTHSRENQFMRGTSEGERRRFSGDLRYHGGREARSRPALSVAETSEESAEHDAYVQVGPVLLSPAAVQRLRRYELRAHFVRSIPCRIPFFGRWLACGWMSEPPPCVRTTLKPARAPVSLEVWWLSWDRARPSASRAERAPVRERARRRHREGSRERRRSSSRRRRAGRRRAAP